jgi:iron complex outermembrane recepter protein
MTSPRDTTQRGRICHAALLTCLLTPAGYAVAAEAPAADTAGEGVLAEIIVTAQRREERLQDVPIAITAMSAEMLEQRNVQSVVDLQGTIPSLAFGGFAGITGLALISLRGVAGQPLPVGASQATAVYLDGVYLSKPDAAFFGLKDIERLEVLRGPQGTLYGRNATAGAINIITRTPTTNPEGAIDVSYGNYDTFTGGGYLSGPIGGHFSASLSGSAGQSDGHTRNTATGRMFGGGDNYSGRLKLRFDNEAGFDATLAGDYSETYSEDPYQVIGLVNGEQSFATETFASNIQDQAGSTVESGGASLVMNIAVSDQFTLTSVTSWRDYEYFTVYDIDASIASLVEPVALNNIDSWSQEVRGLYTGERLRATVGANYYEESGEYRQANRPPGYTVAGLKAASAPYSKTDFHTVAAFAQVEFDLTNSLTAVGGLRFNDETRDFLVDNSAVPPLGTIVSGTVSDSVWLPMLGLNLKASDDVLLYAKFSEGYQAPGYSAGSGPGRPANTFGPESLKAYEVGVKSQFLDRRMTLNGAIFYYDYEDLQVRSLTGPGLAQVTNAGAASVKGAEVEFVVKPLEDLTLDAHVTYSKAIYESYCDGISPSTPQGNDPLCVGTPTPSADRSDNALNQAPLWTGGVGANYVVPMGAEMALALNANYSFESNSYYNATNEKQASTDGWERLDARATFTLRNGLDVYIYGRNLTDERYVTNGARLNAALIFGTLNDPRTYGAGVKYAF